MKNRIATISLITVLVASMNPGLIKVFLEDINIYDFQLTEYLSDQFFPAIHKNLVIWLDSRNDDRELSGCYLLSSQILASPTSTSTLYPSIYKTDQNTCDFIKGFSLSEAKIMTVGVSIASAIAIVIAAWLRMSEWQIFGLILLIIGLCFLLTALMYFDKAWHIQNYWKGDYSSCIQELERIGGDILAIGMFLAVSGSILVIADRKSMKRDINEYINVRLAKIVFGVLGIIFLIEILIIFYLESLSSIP